MQTAVCNAILTLPLLGHLYLCKGVRRLKRQSIFPGFVQLVYAHFSSNTGYRNHKTNVGHTVLTRTSSSKVNHYLFTAIPAFDGQRLSASLNRDSEPTYVFSTGRLLGISRLESQPACDWRAAPPQLAHQLKNSSY